MNRIQRKLEENRRQNSKSFIVFITGGDPDLETTEKLILMMAENGVDVIEIGVPFSDPVAEGAVIQEADERALKNGCTVDGLFEVVRRVRVKTDIPLLFMSYINPIFVYGKEKFMQKSRDCGIDGVIVPDLPYEERDELSDVCRDYGITQISMIAPTSDERIRTIAKDAEGFIYCVSSLGVTGVRDEIKTEITDMINKVRAVTDTPAAVGFGISTPEQAKVMAKTADGVIMGSAVVRVIAEHGRESVGAVKELIGRVRAELGRE
jgi:tryptophan synthase alpha chain